MSFRRHPPSHQALQAFEAAARTGSFLAAAAELSLTASAVSHRIAALERMLGIALFQRLHRAVRLTEAGERYLARVRPVFVSWADLMRLDAVVARPVVRLAATPGIAATWLSDALIRYVRIANEADVLLASRSNPGALLRDEIDIAIQYGRTDDYSGLAGVSERRLMSTRLFPVASPEYLRRVGAPLTPAALAKMTLLHHPQLSWQRWFAAHAVDATNPPSGLLFDDALGMLEAAAQGAGVALTVDTVFQRARVGRALTRLFDTDQPGESYYLALSAAGRARPWVRTFASWLVRDAGGAPGFEPV